MHYEPHRLVFAPAEVATRLEKVPPSGQKYLSVDFKCLAKFISKEFGEAHNCYITKVDKDSTVSLLGSPTIELAFKSTTSKSLHDLHNCLSL